MQSCQKMALTNTGYINCLLHVQTTNMQLDLNDGKILSNKGSPWLQHLSWLQWDPVQLGIEPLQRVVCRIFPDLLHL